MQTGPAEPVLLSSEGRVSRVLAELTYLDTLSGDTRQAMTKQAIALFWSLGLHGFEPRLTIYADLPKSLLGLISLPVRRGCNPYLTGLLCEVCRTGPDRPVTPASHSPPYSSRLIPDCFLVLVRLLRGSSLSSFGPVSCHLLHEACPGHILSSLPLLRLLTSLISLLPS